MGNAAGCASTNTTVVDNQQQQQDRYKGEHNHSPQDYNSKEKTNRDERAHQQPTITNTTKTTTKDHSNEKTSSNNNNTSNNQHNKSSSSNSDEGFESSVIVEIPKGKSLRFITCKDLHQDKETSLMRVLYKLDSPLLGYNNFTLGSTSSDGGAGTNEYMLAVFSNQDKNIIIYTLSDGCDQFYYHIRDAESVHQDSFMVYEDDQLHSYIKSLQHCIQSGDLTIQLPNTTNNSTNNNNTNTTNNDEVIPGCSSNNNSIEIYQKLKNEVNGKSISLSLHLYPLKHNIDINIRDLFMMITKYSKNNLSTPTTTTTTVIDNNNITNITSLSSSIEVYNTPNNSQQVSDLVSSLKHHDNLEVRDLVSRIESILLDPSSSSNNNINSTTTNTSIDSNNSNKSSPLANLLISKASFHNRGVQSTVKDLLSTSVNGGINGINGGTNGSVGGGDSTSEQDSETQKWLSEEVLHGSLADSVSPDLSWKKKIKAYTKALVFTNYLKEMSSNARKNSTDPNSLSTMSLTTIEPKDEIPQPIREYLSKYLLDYFNFNVFEFAQIANNEPLYYCCLYIFQTFDLIQPLNIPLGILKNFLKKIEMEYLNNPYHNNCHATDVVQTAISLYVKCFNGGHLINNSNNTNNTNNTNNNTNDTESTNSSSSTTNSTSQLLVPLDILALVVACLSHDVCHPGVTNLFEKKTRSDRSILFNDKSILENYHCYNLFKILSNEEYNILTNMSSNQFEYLRELIIEMILATDISQHFLIVGQIKSNDLFNKDKFTIERKECLLALLKVIIKCADVSNPTKLYSTYGQWINRVMTEFYNQGDRERQMKLDISPFMDRNLQNVPKCQTGFIEFIVLPLFNLLFEFKQDETEMIKKQLEFNHLSMQDLVKRQQQPSSANNTNNTTTNNTSISNSNTLEMVLENVKLVTGIDCSIIVTNNTNKDIGGDDNNTKDNDSGNETIVVV